MRILRSFAAGLLLSAYFIAEYGVQFSRWYGSNAPLYAFHLAVRSMSPLSADVMGGDVYGPTIFVLLCLGAGLFIGGTVYFAAEYTFMQMFVKAAVALSNLRRGPKVSA